MLLPLFLAFLLGAAAVVAAEGAILLLALRWLRRGKRRPGAENEDRDGGQPIPSRNAKKGIIWVLEPEKIQKASTDESPPRLPNEQKNKDIVEVFPVKKYARIKDHSLILTDVDGSEGTIELHNCTIVAVSASNLSSRKWAKRYPIKLESKTSLVYNRSKACYLYLETSWEKESWCKELRLASCLDKKKKIWYAQLTEEFHAYLVALNSEYPSFLKSSTLFGAYTDRANKIDGPSSKVRLFLKKIAKKASKTTTESRPSSTTPSTHDERKNGENLPSLQDISRTDGFVKSSLKNSLPSASMQDPVQSSSPTSDTLENGSQNSTSPDAVCNEKFVYDEGTLCWNLLFSRLFFDAKRNIEINAGIKARIQKTLSNMRTPSYIGGVICTDLDLGNLPPYIHKMRVLPIGLNEVWAVEIDIEYLGGILLDFETRIGVCEPELQDDIMKTSPEPSSAGELTVDLLDGLEHYGNQLISSNNPMDRTENTDEGKAELQKQSKSSRWASTYISRWKTIKQSFADQVSQTSMAVNFKLFKDLIPHEESAKLNAYIIRTWEVNTTTTRTLDFIIIDTEGDQLHGWVPKSLSARFQNYLREETAVTIENFRLIENKFRRFCPVRHKYSIELNRQSKVNELDGTIVFPKPKFEFAEFKDLKDRVNDESFLTDFIGIFKKISDIKEYGEKKNRKRDMLIEDESGHTLRITFWNNDINLIPSTLSNNGDKHIVVVTSTVVKQYNGIFYLKVTLATKIYVDIDIPQVDNLKTRLISHKRRAFTPDNIKTIEAIHNQLEKKLEGEYVCHAIITKVHDELEWYYKACPTCWKKIKDYQSENTCSCGSHFDEPAFRYMLQLEIQDNTGELKVTAFANEATELLSTPIHDMIRIEEEEGFEAVVARLNKLVNKQYLFQLKITAYNTMHPTRALTITAILDQDLAVQKKAKTETESM